MKRGIRGRSLAVVSLLVLSFPCAEMGQEQWTWKDRDGKTRTRSDLDQILAEHKLWRESKGARGRRADLSTADLSGAKLSEVNLSGAQLGGQEVTFSSYRSEDFSKVHVQWTKPGVNLRGADLSYADLSGATLMAANLSSADLRAANLTGANLNYAELADANLEDAELKDAYLKEANVEGARFEPKSNPEIRGVAAAKHLELLTYDENPDSLAQLRKQFQDNGFRTQERTITYSLKKRQAEFSWDGCTSRQLPGDKTRAILWSSDGNLSNCASFVLNRMFFDWTCQYGMSPGRPLLLAFALFVLCSGLYFACIHSSGRSALQRVYGQGLESDPTSHRRVERIQPGVLSRGTWWMMIGAFLWRELRVLGTAMFFSLMSAFNIGFRDINFGRWLRLLTRQEFDIKAVGWARVAAGWQSLISVYLIALWVLTYFGRPFE